MPIDAVIFDWGGTLTSWHDIDFDEEAAALARAVRLPDDPPSPDFAQDRAEEHRSRLRSAADVIWGRSRDHHHSATIEDIFTEAGLAHDPEALGHYEEFWDPHTATDGQVLPLWQWLREGGIKVGVLSNTIWPRAWHHRIFRRDGVLDLIDGDVYSSEIAWTKPSRQAFSAAMGAVGADDPARCVYVGDRLYDDIWGAQQAGMRAIHIPHSTIPAAQRGANEGVPDAIAVELAEIRQIVTGWR